MLLEHTTTPTPAPRPASRPQPEPLVVKLTTVESPTVIPQTPRRLPPQAWVAAAAAVLVGWAFFPTLDWLVGTWSNDASYSHGFLVPPAAAFLVWHRRKQITQWFSTPLPLAAGGVLAAVLGVRMLAGGMLFHHLDCLALILSVAAGVLGVGGWRLVKNCWPGLVFLLFMVPLPYEWEQNLGGPLKTVATVSSTYLLQAFGFPAIHSGNVIHIDEVEMGVVDACNGLKMLLTFAATAAGAILLLKRSWFEKLVIALGVVPIAVLSNVLRITATGMLYATVVHDADARHAMHDALGYGMAVLGVGFLLLELWVLNKLIVKPATPASRTA